MARRQQSKENMQMGENSVFGFPSSEAITIEDAIEQLRNRLLDLSARNSLLNFRHPKGRCIQIAADTALNLVFERLYLEGKALPFKYVPEPAPDSYEGKRPDAKQYAADIGISTSFEFPAGTSAADDSRRLRGLQVLRYPDELERQLRKIANEGRTAIEETGTNMLFLIFGFLEFYDSEDSERPLLAPLLSVPVELLRGEVDGDTRTYQYTLQHNGEDLVENRTLGEKLRQDFALLLPEFGEESQPETYFFQLEQAIKTKRRWKVRRQITLGMLSFGKLAIWADLDTKKRPALAEHALIRAIFSGEKGHKDSEMFAQDYAIDTRLDANQPLIYEADSSQHSAIIDSMAGKNIVINGPPGTGKSQTITNIIASALSKGKKILFVSEKVAALEVVRHRLNKAGLGDFCLELHSHKTQKKKFLEDIQSRIDANFREPPRFEEDFAILKERKLKLARYAELMGSHAGNALGLTINEVFWRAERFRQELGDLSATAGTIGLAEVSKWRPEKLERQRSRLEGLVDLYEVVGRFDASHPWWGFRPVTLTPGDDDAVAGILLKALELAHRGLASSKEIAERFGYQEQPDLSTISTIRELLYQMPPLPDNALTATLELMFDEETDPKGQTSGEQIAKLKGIIDAARKNYETADKVLTSRGALTHEVISEFQRKLTNTAYLQLS